MSNLHKNPWGSQCHCPWGQQSHLGHVKEAAKIDWLRGRPDVKQDPRKRLLVNHVLPKYGEEVDPLLPWVMREHNQGRLTPHTNIEYFLEEIPKLEQAYTTAEPAAKQEIGEQLKTLTNGLEHVTDQGYGLNYTNSNGVPFHVGEWLPKIADMTRTLKRRGQGINLDQHTFSDLLGRLSAHQEEEKQRKEEELRRNNGQVVHKFDGPRSGWSVRRLTNRDECSLEGELMGHCVGAYGNQVDQGHTNIYSLRDPKNEPHATMEITPHGTNPEDPAEWVLPHHAWDELPMQDFQGVPIEDIRNLHDHGPYNYHDHPASSVYPEFMRRAVEHGTAMPPVQGEITQTQGRSNASPLPEYTDMLDEFLAPHNMEAQSYKPWWDDWYEMNGPETFRELVGHNGDNGEPFGLRGDLQQDLHEIEPDEYANARSDAEEHGLEEPELRVNGPDYHRILESLIDPPVEHEYDWKERQYVTGRPWQGYNPTAGAYVLNHAQAADAREREHPEWAPHRQEPANHTRELTQALQQHRSEAADEIQRFRFVPPPELGEIEDPRERRRALEEAEQQHYHELGYADDPHIQMLNHLGPELLSDYEPYGPPQTYHQLHPEQQQLWSPDGMPYNFDRDSLPSSYDPARDGPLQGVFSKLAHPLYTRWVYSPASGQVTIADNSGDPLDVRYHTDLARELNEPNLVHGFAYRIGDGWRLYDWDHKPLKDPYVVAQVMRALLAAKQPDGSWEPDDQDWERVHAGNPG